MRASLAVAAITGLFAELGFGVVPRYLKSRAGAVGFRQLAFSSAAAASVGLLLYSAVASALAFALSVPVVGPERYKQFADSVEQVGMPAFVLWAVTTLVATYLAEQIPLRSGSSSLFGGMTENDQTGSVRSLGMLRGQLRDRLWERLRLLTGNRRLREFDRWASFFFSPETMTDPFFYVSILAQEVSKCPEKHADQDGVNATAEKLLSASKTAETDSQLQRALNAAVKDLHKFECINALKMVSERVSARGRLGDTD